MQYQGIGQWFSTPMEVKLPRTRLSVTLACAPLFSILIDLSILLDLLADFAIDVSEAAERAPSSQSPRLLKATHR